MQMTVPAETKPKRSSTKHRLTELQSMMSACADLLHESGRSLVLVFEGLDASGKSGCIKRLINELDMKQYHVHPTAKPTPDEYAHPYLWRFWKNLPERGDIAIFDRSWYGRVLVERVEHFCSPTEWQRAYEEINAFEKQLFDDGYLLVKLWLDVSDAEQLARFRSRQSDPSKEYKLTDEDWRNRSKRPQYDLARDDMLARTNKGYAPWYILPADDKKNARAAVMESVLTWVDLLL